LKGRGWAISKKLIPAQQNLLTKNRARAAMGKKIEQVLFTIINAQAIAHQSKSCRT